MARESASPQGPSTSLRGRPTESHGGVDTATRVLSRRELEAVRAELARAEAEAGAGEADAVARGAGGGKAGGADAVVQSAGDGNAVAEDAGGSAVDSGDVGAEAEADGADVAEAESVQGAVDGAGSGASGKGDDADASGDDRLRAAVAAWVASSDTADEGAEAADARDQAEGSGADADGAGSGFAEDAAAVSASDDGDDVGGKGADTAPKADSSAKAGGDTEASDKATDAEPAGASGADEASAAAKAAREGSNASPEVAAVEDAQDAQDVEDAAVGADVAADDAPADDTAAGDGTAAEDTPAATEPATEPDNAQADAPAGAPEATDPADAPAPADGESAPQGPPAPGDESRTGGAGGNTKAEGEAEAVDQPTAVFKAVRPKPHVDQPTTMLKAPKQPEAPAERTSKFVALKPDIRPDTPKTPETPGTQKAPSAAPKASAPGATPKAPAPPPDVTAAIPQVGPERTTQQPLPPKPPLDLLAELTNTPPPPDTPVRTLIRRVKIWTPLVLLLAIIFAIAQAVRPLPTPTLALTAEESYAFDGTKAALPWPGEGQGWMDVNGIGTMGNFGKQTPVAIGSVAKAMTAYVVLKDHPLKAGQDGEKIKIDALAEKEGGYDKDGESTLNTVKEGDVITLHDAIAAIMIPSANNIARLLARWDAGTEKAFIEKMNATAKELGMTNTTYTDASGLKESTVSTAEDQVKLGNELVKIPALMEITAMGQWIDPSGKKHYNYNYLVPYNGAIGIKTGTTTAAGGNLLFAARKEVGGETVTLVGAILGQHKSPIIQTVNDVSKTAMLAAQDELTSAKILKKGDVVGYVDDGLGGHTPVVLTEDVTAVGWPGFEVKLSFDADDVPHTAKAGTKVGTLTVGDGTSGAVKVPVALQTDLTEPGFTQKLTRVL
ncbi:D-alanyl-D-alanine carboxypeptidase [Streptomyces sp. CA-251387]|uniref:D-alanyl-D-alanine carboxypeptidase n=1 Tax=Streptomyces sp. CA-251387 TaxID=3240064 RepID=UPI003D8AF4F1